MAKGSEPAVRWSNLPGVKRECSGCGKKLKIEDVAEVRTTYPGKRVTVWGHCCFPGPR